MSDLTRARWGELAQGYESFYLRAAEPGGGRGVWIRYTVHRRAGVAPTGSLWFTLFEPDGPTAAKVTLPDPRTGTGDWLRIAGARIGDGAAHGHIRVPGGADVTWELTFTGTEPLAHLPRDWMYRPTVLPSTKPVSLHPVARFDGTLTVNGREVTLTGWPGMVGHNWGTRHAERWIWLHGMGFAGADDGTWLDVVLARIKVAGRRTPWLASGAVSVDGERYRLGGPHRVRRTAVFEQPDRLEFSLPGTNIAVTGRVSAPRERFVGWVYADPDGSEHHALNCSIADLELVVSRADHPPAALTSAGMAAYELGLREHDHGIAVQPFADG